MPPISGRSQVLAHIGVPTHTFTAPLIYNHAPARREPPVTAAKAAAYASATDPASWSGAVYRLYLATLGREPDAGGFVSWSARLAAGADVTAVTSGFVASPEFQARYGALDDSGFVTLLYRNVLGRDPDSAGLQSWADSLAAGTSRAAVVRGFSDSPEFIARTEAAQASWMRSAAADDSLVGGAGDDFLAGGAGADTFTFDVSDTGQDVVLDLEPWDTLRFTGFGYLDGADARLYLSQSGSDVLFSDNGVQVLIRDWQMSEITDQMLAI